MKKNKRKIGIAALCGAVAVGVAAGCFFLIINAPKAPISEAILPKTISGTIHPVRKFESAQPIKSPGIADGVNMASTVSASDNLHCTAPFASPKIAVM